MCVCLYYLSGVTFAAQQCTREGDFLWPLVQKQTVAGCGGRGKYSSALVLNRIAGLDDIEGRYRICDRLFHAWAGCIAVFLRSTVVSGVRVHSEAITRSVE